MNKYGFVSPYKEAGIGSKAAVFGKSTRNKRYKKKDGNITKQFNKNFKRAMSVDWESL